MEYFTHTQTLYLPMRNLAPMMICSDNQSLIHKHHRDVPTYLPMDVSAFVSC